VRNQVGALQFLGSFPERPPETGLPEVAFAGRSNVGKSSMLNTLLRSHKAARVSSRPGRTQLINLFQLGSAAVFADLPGYGYAAVPDEVAARWKPMIETYLADRAALRLVVLLVDTRHEAQALDRMLLDGLRDFGLRKHQRKPAAAALAASLGLPEGQPLLFSSKDNFGLDALWEVIEAACGKAKRR